MKIAWIILTWNSEKYIEKCINSILKLSEIQNQIIVADNGSRDGTVRLLRERYKNIVCLIEFSKNMGTTVSRNVAIKKADQDVDYICVLDSDTEVNMQAVVYLTDVLKKEPNAFMAGPELVTQSGEVQPSARNFPTITSKIFKACPIKKIEKIGRQMEQCKNTKNTAYFKVGVIMSACWMIKPVAFKELGLLDEYYFYSPEDTEFCLRIHLYGKDVLYCPDVAIIHDWQRLSKKKIVSKFNYESLKGHIHMFRQYHYCFSTKKLYKEENI